MSCAHRSPRSSATSNWFSRTRSSRSPTSSGDTSRRWSATRTGCCAWSAICCSPLRSTPDASASSRATSTWPGVVRSAEETARVTAAAAGVQVVVDVPAEGLVVPGDAVRLGQACDNLVSNAVKFTPSGGQVTLSLRAAWVTADGEVSTDQRPGSVPVARLSVSDTGMGIPAGEQGKLFTRFFRSSTAQRNAVPGVGLGLAITKAIAIAHGGALDLVSAEGEGATFTMTLPRAAG